MFLIPLGLQSRIIRWPIASILILVITSVITILLFSENALYIRHVRQAVQESHVYAARVQLLKDSCTNEFDAKPCAFIRAFLDEKDLWDLGPFLKKMKKDSNEMSFLDLQKISRWLEREDVSKVLKDESKTLPSYQAYLSALDQYHQKILEKAKEDKLLMRGNMKPLPALKALVTHEGWVHLIGNMLIFVLFSVFLEQRIGFLGLFGLYLLGGIVSNFVQTPFLPMGIRLLGASGAVSAVIGAFTVYFWRERMRCFMTLAFFYNRVILMPAWLYIGFFVVASDVIGMMSTGSSVAHLAHLGGLLFGAMFAYVQSDLFPLKKTFLFLHEQKLYYQAKELDLLEEKLAVLQRIYSVNKESFYSFRALFIYFCKKNFQLSSFKKEDTEFISKLITGCFAYQEKNEKLQFAQEIVGLVPLSWNMAAMDLHLTAEMILSRAEFFRGAGDYIQTLRLYDLFFAKFAVDTRAQEVQADIMKIFDLIERYEAEPKAHVLEALLAYADHHPENHFQTQIRQLIHQVHREEKNAAG